MVLVGSTARVGRLTRAFVTPIIVIVAPPVESCKIHRVLLLGEEAPWPETHYISPTHLSWKRSHFLCWEESKSMLKYKLFSVFAIVVLLTAACGGAQPTTAPQAQATATTGAAEPEGTPTRAPLTVGNLPDVPRNQQAVLGWSITSPIGVTNPWAVPGYTHQEGNVFLWEPLAYYGIFASEEIPWLADSMEYTNDDFTELTIK